jgi:hypothetical protein
MGGAPADRLHAPVQDRWPDRAADVVAAGGDRDRKAAIAIEPVRGFRHQRTEGRGRTETDGEMHRNELPDRRRQACADVTEPENADPEPDRGDDAVAIGDLSGQHAAGTEAEHDQGKGQRRGATGRGELRLDHRQRHHHRPHPDAAERTDQHSHR